MAILGGNVILSSDYTGIAGAISSNAGAIGATPSTPGYPDDASATGRLSAIYGVGFGTRGYGQTTHQLPAIKPGNLISSANWIALRNVLIACSSHVNYELPLIPDSSFYGQNEIITAQFTGSSSVFDWEGAARAIDSRRLNAPSVVITTSALTSTRTTKWTGAPFLEFLADFGNEDNARYFFNSGGEIKINSSLTSFGSGQPQSQSWSNLLSTCGIISIGANATSQSGSGGVSAAKGFYDLSDSSSRLFIQYASDTPYTVNYIDVTAQRKNYAGINGGNGSQILFQVKFNDAYGSIMDYVQGTLSATVEISKAGGSLTINSPVITQITGLNQGGNPPLFLFSDTISQTVINYNLLSRAASSGYNPGLGIPLIATIKIEPGVVVGSGSTDDASMTIPSLVTDSTVSIYNSGYIIGKGGDGGPSNSHAAAGSGLHGGAAIKLEWVTLITNYGIIGGGGGGGGGSTSWSSSQTYDDPGGGGGGGAGYQTGAGGTTLYVNIPFADPGDPGSLLTGGAGGTPFPHGNSREWWQADVGGKGGDLGQNGESGTGSYGGGTGGVAGESIQGFGLVAPGSSLGDCRGPTS